MNIQTSAPRISLEQVISMLEIYRQTADVTLSREPGNQTARQLSVLTENALIYLQVYKSSIPSFEYLKEAFIKSKLEVMRTEGGEQ